MAGSVMPSQPEMPDGRASSFVFMDLVFTKTARQAAPCATLQQEMMGLKLSTPVLAMRVASSALNMWCTPRTTVIG